MRRVRLSTKWLVFLAWGTRAARRSNGPAREGNADAIAFPRGLANEGYDFSFSGLKTSVIRYMRANPEAPLADVAASFQEAVVDVLVAKTKKAAAEVGAKAICIGGGVAANTSPPRTGGANLRRKMVTLAFIPSRAMCTDNAAMIGAAACYRLRTDGPTPLDAPVDPNLRLAARMTIGR